MTKKEIASRKREIKAQIGAGNTNEAFERAIDLVVRLWDEKAYSEIVAVYRWTFLKPKHKLWLFHVAYSLDESRDQNEAERIYEYLHAQSPDDPSVLNNLSNIKKAKNQIDRAWNLIQHAYELTPHDEIISSNYNNLLSVVNERREIDALFKNAVHRLDNENNFVVGKLRAFLANAVADPECDALVIPIPNWKFRALMQTDTQKADSLRDQWLDKGYIRRTGERGAHNEHIYQINPYLEPALASLEKTKVPVQWVSGMERLDAEHLQRHNYFGIVERISKVRKKYRSILTRDLDELFFNYLVGNRKATVVLAGSIVETLLIYHCEKRKIKEISYTRGKNQIRRKLYDANLGDLLSHLQEHGVLSEVLGHMGNISRITRNIVHPGKELRDTEQLTADKAEICFRSVLEIVSLVCSRGT